MEGLGVWSLRNPNESGFISIQMTDDDYEPSPVGGYERVVTQIKTSAGSKKFLYTDSCPKFPTPYFYLQK